MTLHSIHLQLTGRITDWTDFIIRIMRQVLRMIEMTIQGAHKHGKWVGICGELGADTTLTERFIKMGIDELSVSPSMVLGVRSRICEME